MQKSSFCSREHGEDTEIVLSFFNINVQNCVDVPDMIRATNGQSKPSIVKHFVPTPYSTGQWLHHKRLWYKLPL